MQIKIDENQLNQWKQQFNLTYDWGVLPATLPCNFGLATLNKKVDDGYLLAEQQLKITQFPELNQRLTIEAKITAQKQFKKFSYLNCRVIIAHKEQQQIKLDSKLIKTNSAAKAKQLKSYETADPWRKFSSKEVYNFSQMAGDPNPIHLTKQPIVQGMLLFLTLEDYLTQQDNFWNQIAINYSLPIYSGQLVKLTQPKPDELLGIVEDNICFSLTTKEALT